jgi:hypothetical protein
MFSFYKQSQTLKTSSLLLLPVKDLGDQKMLKKKLSTLKK